MLLEEQVHDLKSRLANRDRSNDASIELGTQLQTLEQEIKEWKRLAKDYCPNSATTVSYLRTFIEDIQKRHLILASDANTVQREKTSINEQMATIRQQNEQHTKNIDALNKTLRNYQATAHRMQKKLMLIAKERDCFKTLLENYEKDLTISMSAVSASTEASIDTELRARLDVVEKSLAGYKEICKTLEEELELARTSSNGGKF